MANKKEAKNDIDLSKINKELDSKKEDILKEVEDKKEEVIKELDSKIESKVEVAVNEKIKTYEKKVVKTKNYKILRRDIVIIILLGLIIYAGYYMYKNDYFNIMINKNNVISTPNDPQEEIKYDSAYYIKNYGYLINNIFINDNELVPFDMVICDNYLPVYDDEYETKPFGKYIVTRIRKVLNLTDLPIVMCSSEDVGEFDYNYKIRYDSSVIMDEIFKTIIDDINDKKKTLVLAKNNKVKL